MLYNLVSTSKVTDGTEEIQGHVSFQLIFTLIYFPVLDSDTLNTLLNRVSECWRLRSVFYAHTAERRVYVSEGFGVSTRWAPRPADCLRSLRRPTTYGRHQPRPERHHHRVRVLSHSKYFLSCAFVGRRLWQRSRFKEGVGSDWWSRRWLVLLESKVFSQQKREVPGGFMSRAD